MALLLRILLSSSIPGDKVLDPFAGTATTLAVAEQLGRKAPGIEIDPGYVQVARDRLGYLRPSDDVTAYWDYYRFTENLEAIWNPEITISLKKPQVEARSLFQSSG